MAPLGNGYANGTNGSLTNGVTNLTRFSDIPSAIDIPVSGLDTEEAVEVNLEDLLDDSTELCQLLENEKAAKNFWIMIALAYAKQHQIDHAIEILNKGLISLGRSGPKEKLSLLGCVCWLYLLKSRQAPRVPPEDQLVSEAKTKDHFLREATSTINDASRINPAFPPLFLTRGVLSLLRASLQSSSRAVPGAADSERLESLRQALKCFDDASKSSGGRNMMAVLGKARTLYLLGRYSDALQGYQEVLGKVPSLTDPDPRIGIGCCLWRLGFKERAKAAWERSLELKPDSKVANALLGIYYLAQSAQHSTNDPEFGTLYKTAMTQYTQKAYKIDKEFPLSSATFGNYFLLRKAYPTVEVLARKAIEQTDVNAIASDGWFLLARKEHNENETQKASDYYNRADQARGGMDKGYWPAKFGAIQLLVATNDFDGAKFRLEKLLPTSRNLEATTLLGCLYAEEVFAVQASGSKEDKLVESQKAISYLEIVRKSWKDPKTKHDPDESVLLYLARLYETSQPAESMRCLLEVEKMQLDSILNEDKPQLLDVDDEDKKLDYTKQLRVNLPPQLLNNIGCFHFQAENYKEAIINFELALQACQRISNDEGADADAYVTTISYNMGRACEEVFDFDEAKELYSNLLVRHKDYTDAAARMTYITLRESPTDAGPKAMAKLYETDSTNIEVRALFGWYLNRSKRKVTNIAEDHEQRHYKHTLQGYDKHDKYSLTGMGNIYLLTARDMKRDTEADRDKRRKMYERAVEFFDKALQLDPRNAYAGQGIAIALVDDKRDFGAAVQIFSRVRDTLRDASVYLNLGHVYSELRQYQRSIENYELALQKDTKKENPQILACLSRAWLLKGQAEKSIPHLNNALHYSERALLGFEVKPPHLEFNVAFIQFQIAQMVYTLSESQRSAKDIVDARDGLEAAIESFTSIAKSKNPPYSRTVMEQRASMGKNTMRNQLQRALQAQTEYESRNMDKLQKARQAREEEKRRQEEEKARLLREEMERQEKMKQERLEMVKRTEEMMDRVREEERRRAELEMTTDEETGERVKRKKKPAGGKRKKREDGVVSDDDVEALGRRSDSGLDSRSRSVTANADSGDGAAQKRERQPKRRKLERKRKINPKIKSSELVVDSDDDDDDMEVAAPVRESETPVTPGILDDSDAPSSPAPNVVAGQDIDMEDPASEDDEDDVVPAQAAPPARRRKQLRMIADEEEDDEEAVPQGEDGAPAASNGNVGLANAAMAAMNGSDDEE